MSCKEVSIILKMCCRIYFFICAVTIIAASLHADNLNNLFALKTNTY